MSLDYNWNTSANWRVQHKDAFVLTPQPQQDRVPAHQRKDARNRTPQVQVLKSTPASVVVEARKPLVPVAKLVAGPSKLAPWAPKVKAEQIQPIVASEPKPIPERELKAAATSEKETKETAHKDKSEAAPKPASPKSPKVIEDVVPDWGTQEDYEESSFTLLAAMGTAVQKRLDEEDQKRAGAGEKDPLKLPHAARMAQNAVAFLASKKPEAERKQCEAEKKEKISFAQKFAMGLKKPSPTVDATAIALKTDTVSAAALTISAVPAAMAPSGNHKYLKELFYEVQSTGSNLFKLLVDRHSVKYLRGSQKTVSYSLTDSSQTITSLSKVMMDGQFPGYGHLEIVQMRDEYPTLYNNRGGIALRVATYIKDHPIVVVVEFKGKCEQKKTYIRISQQKGDFNRKKTHGFDAHQIAVNGYLSGESMPVEEFLAIQRTKFNAKQPAGKVCR